MGYRINLNEIPEEGRLYEFDRKSGELNAILADLIKDRPFKASLFIRPMGNAYELTGSIQTQTPDICSKCGNDLEVPVTRKIKEFLMEAQDDSHRKSHSVHGNQSVDFSNESASVAYYEGNQFEAGEFVHEAIALGEPFYPECGTNDCLERQEVNRKILEAKGIITTTTDDEPHGHPGFAALKDLKLNFGLSSDAGAASNGAVTSTNSGSKSKKPKGDETKN